MNWRLKTGLGVAAVLAASYGAAYLWLGSPVRDDRYTAIDAGTIEVVPAQCALNRLGLGCRAEALRLSGVDAFESTQTCRDAQGKPWPCGAVAAARLKELVAKPDFSCRIDPEFVDNRGREFSTCVSGGEDVGAVLISEGLAFAYGRGAQYLPLEEEAKAEKRGAWAGHFVRPQYYSQGATE
jgi:endonuclease YncB( thermonuclease family)